MKGESTKSVLDNQHVSKYELVSSENQMLSSPCSSCDPCWCRVLWVSAGVAGVDDPTEGRRWVPETPPDGRLAPSGVPGLGMAIGLRGTLFLGNSGGKAPSLPDVKPVPPPASTLPSSRVKPSVLVCPGYLDPVNPTPEDTEPPVGTLGYCCPGKNWVPRGTPLPLSCDPYVGPQGMGRVPVALPVLPKGVRG